MKISEQELLISNWSLRNRRIVRKVLRMPLPLKLKY